MQAQDDVALLVGQRFEGGVLQLRCLLGGVVHQAARLPLLKVTSEHSCGQHARGRSNKKYRWEHLRVQLPWPAAMRRQPQKPRSHPRKPASVPSQDVVEQQGR